MADILDLPFDQYQRYRVAQEAIQILKAHLCGKGRLKILDVGGYADYHGSFLPLKLFLPDDDVFVCDLVDFSHPRYVKADGANLPFRKETFNIIACVDVLEHVPQVKRLAVLDQLIDAASDFLLLIGPFHSEVVSLAEKILQEFFKRQLNSEPPFLVEHLDLGLPQLDGIRARLDRLGLNYIVFPSGYVHNWLFMNLLKAYIASLPESSLLQTLADRYYNLNFYENDQIEPAYRQAIVASKRSDAVSLAALKDVERLFSSYRERSLKRSLLDGDPSSLIAFMDYLSLKTYKDIHIANLEAVIRTRDECLQRILEDKDRHIANLEAIIRAREEELRALREELQAAAAKKDEDEALLRSKYQQIDSLLKALQDKDRHIANLEALLRSKYQQIDSLLKALQDKDRHIRNLESFLDQIRGQLAAMC